MGSAKRSKCGKSFSSTGYVPDSLLIHILHRMPVKSVFRSKCVSKQWLSIISEPSFVEDYVARVSHSQPRQWTFLKRSMHVEGSIPLEYDLLRNLNASLIDNKSTSISMVAFPGNEKQQQESLSPHGDVIVAISNGVLLCRRTDMLNVYDYCIFNPITRCCIVLPPPTSSVRSFSEGFLTHVEGGTIVSFKVVRLEKCKELTTIQNFEVFDSETGEWQEYKANLPQAVSSLFCLRPVAFNGILHWFDWVAMDFIIAYDPYKNPSCCRLINLPGSSRGMCDVFQGRLACIELSSANDYDDRQDDHGFDWNLNLWTLQDYDKEDWNLEKKDTISDVSDDQWAPMAFHPLNPDVFYFFGKGTRVASLNVQTKKLEVADHPDLVGDAVAWYWLLLFQFVLPPWPTAIPQPTWKALKS
ncbi:hypothetical protein RJ639_024789 [Escallonia herrerae]|nr:hypothetical protein RJ639_024789 [Escallonia herrerae]